MLGPEAGIIGEWMPPVLHESNDYLRAARIPDSKYKWRNGWASREGLSKVLNEESETIACIGSSRPHRNLLIATLKQSEQTRYLGTTEYVRITQPVGHTRELRDGRGLHFPHYLPSVDLNRHFAYSNIIGYLLV
jgi:hypothetical protein